MLDELKSTSTVNEQKSESMSVFQGAAILLGMLGTADNSRFFWCLGAAVILLLAGMAQRTFMKVIIMKAGSPITPPVTPEVTEE